LLTRLTTMIALCGALAFAACGDDEETEPSGGGGAATTTQASENLSGTVRSDGSSTVAPLAEAASELFGQQNPGVRVSVGTSGTGGGFERFCRGESDISNASRQIDEEEEQTCQEAGVQFEELTVANDALSVVVNPNNDFVDCLTVEELNKIWDRGSDVSNWNQVREGFPDQEIELYGPGTDSGTFDYFTDAINGDEGVQRSDYNNVGEDDNAVITGVSGNEGALGYLPLSFVIQNEGKVKPVPIRNPETDQCVEPSEQTVQDRTYVPLGRGLFMYPSAEALQRPEVQAYLRFIIEQNDQVTERATFIPLTAEQKQEAQATVEELSQGGGSGGSGGTTTGN